MRRTLGGRQFWTDLTFFRGWRIQKNAWTGSCRLLDPQQKRWAHGTREHCRAVLNTIRQEQKLPPMSGRAIVLMHGLIRSSRSFHRMVRRLEQENVTVVPFDYSSTRLSIPEAADCLNEVISGLEGIDSIDLVVHSMGGLVLRCWLRDHEDGRIRRAVLMGVPNHGAQIADRLHRHRLFRVLYGPAGQQLVSDPEGFIASLPIPDFEFGIIAGGRGQVRGFNPLLPGDNDSTVTVHSARLSGARDFLLVPVIHSFLMADSRCIEAVACFLKHGRFHPDRSPQPVP